MKKGSVCYLLTLIMLCMGMGSLRAQNFVTNGNASYLGGSCYELTADIPGQAGSIFSNTSINLTQPFAFDAVFNFGTKDNNGADGIVFILATTNTALGGGGGSLGYEGITPSIAIEYDDYFNGGSGDPVSDHMAVLSMGSVNHNLPSSLVPPIDLANIEDGEDYCFSVVWDPATQTLTAALNSEIISYTGDIVTNIFSGSPIVYYGFSSGTGSLSNHHIVCFGAPQLVPMPDVTICEGEDVALQADENGIAWTWAPSPTLTDLNVSDPTADPIITTTYTVAIDYACGGFARDTVEVTVVPAPNATADNSSPICIGESVQLFASGGLAYHWTGPMGYSSLLQNPVINNVTIPKSGIYTVTVTGPGGCTSEAETEVILFDPPFVEIDPLPGPLCESGPPVQLIGTPAGGMWTGVIEDDGTFDPGAAGEGNYVISYTVTDANGCTNSDQFTVEVVPNIPAEILPEGPFCVTEQSVTLTANPPGGIWGESADSDGQVYPSDLGVGSFLVTYELHGPDECNDVQITIDVVDAPLVNITAPGPLCLNAPPQTLNAIPAGGIWSGAVNSSGQFDPAALGSGTHQAIYTVQSGNCANADTIDIVILGAPPQISNVSYTCDSLATSYIISFSILGGDTSSYEVQSVIGGVFVPGVPYSFTTDPIPSGNTYDFLLDDIHHCAPVSLVGSYSCLCATNAGVMDITPLSLCVDDAASVMPPTGFVLEPDDTLIYILHAGDPSNVLEIINPNSITFHPPLIPGVTYFISAVVGNAVPGGVDFSDPCLGVSAGKPITWTALPAGFLQAPGMICTGDSFDLNFVLSGTGPFDIVYSDGTNSFPLNGINAMHSISVSPISTTTYTLVSVLDHAGPGCTVAPDTSLTVIVSTVIQAQEFLSICKGDSVYIDSAYRFTQGVFFENIPGVVGCDTILETYLLVYNPDTTMLIGTTCDAAQTGVFETHLQNQLGCDSVLISTITLIDPDSTYLNEVTCDPNAAGDFVNMFTGDNGCDSLVFTTISLLASDTTQISSADCDLANTGVFTQTLTNQAGCDSIVIETISLLPSDTSLLFQFSCLPADTGTFTLVLQNQAGCDSTTITTVSLISSWLTTDSLSTCDPTAAGVDSTLLISSQGCDSLVIITTQLFPSDTVSIFAESCSPSDTGTIAQHLTNIFGCDSLVQLITMLLPEDSCIEVSHEVYIPNVFSPNDDGINDLFTISPANHSVKRVLYMRIYDRWGSLLFENLNFFPDDVGSAWDGRLDEKLLNPGVFVWTIGLEFEDGVEENLYGSVTLVR